MAYSKLAPLAIFLLTILFVIFPMKKVEAASCGGNCYPFGNQACGEGCYCMPGAILKGFCVEKRRSSIDVIKMIEENPMLCQSHVDCMKKGSGSFCALYPNPDIEYGRCFASNSKAEDFLKIVSKYKFTKDFLKMPTSA